MNTTVQVPSNIRPFHVDIPDEKLADLRRRLAATRWPSPEPASASRPSRLLSANLLSNSTPTNPRWSRDGKSGGRTQLGVGDPKAPPVAGVVTV